MARTIQEKIAHHKNCLQRLEAKQHHKDRIERAVAWRRKDREAKSLYGPVIALMSDENEAAYRRHMAKTPYYRRSLLRLWHLLRCCLAGTPYLAAEGNASFARRHFVNRPTCFEYGLAMADPHLHTLLAEHKDRFESWLKEGLDAWEAAQRGEG